MPRRLSRTNRPSIDQPRQDSSLLSAPSGSSMSSCSSSVSNDSGLKSPAPASSAKKRNDGRQRTNRSESPPSTDDGGGEFVNGHPRMVVYAKAGKRISTKTKPPKTSSSEKRDAKENGNEHHQPQRPPPTTTPINDALIENGSTGGVNGEHHRDERAKPKKSRGRCCSIGCCIILALIIFSLALTAALVFTFAEFSGRDGTDRGSTIGGRNRNSPIGINGSTTTTTRRSNATSITMITPTTATRMFEADATDQSTTAAITSQTDVDNNNPA